MASQVKLVAADPAAGLSLPTTMLREVAGESRRFSFSAALHVAVALDRDLVPASLGDGLGHHVAAPKDLLVSKLAEYKDVPAAAELDDDAAPAMLRAAVAARLKMSSEGVQHAARRFAGNTRGGRRPAFAIPRCR